MALFTASCDTPETNSKYAKALKLDYPILSDPSKTTAKAYGVVHAKRKVPERWTFFISKSGKIAAIQKKVKAAKHGEEISQKLKELGVPQKKKKA